MLDGTSRSGRGAPDAADSAARQRVGRSAVFESVTRMLRADPEAQQISRPTSQLRDLSDMAAIVVAIGLIGLVAEGAAGLPRVVLALAFAAFVPGRAVVANWPRIAYWSELGMSMVLSLAILTLVATLALWAHAWHPVGIFGVEACLSIAALVVGIIRRHQASAKDAAGD
jgi:uncharacterized membrane protein